MSELLNGSNLFLTKYRFAASKAAAHDLGLILTLSHRAGGGSASQRADPIAEEKTASGGLLFLLLRLFKNCRRNFFNEFRHCAQIQLYLSVVASESLVDGCLRSVSSIRTDIDMSPFSGLLNHQ